MSVVAEQHRLFKSGQRNTRASAAMDQVRSCAVYIYAQYGVGGGRLLVSFFEAQRARAH